MNIVVTSVSKKEEKLSRTAAAIFVITQEDIRRSGDTNIPDLLRMVPGLDVAQINANTWAISARGLNGRYSNELLVMVDGRSVYTPTFGGVFWDVLDMPLEDIERIEVIRGPGGSVWGANAVNGVINIITKDAAETLGGMVEAGGGNLDQGFGTAQYGGKLGTETDYRVYTKYFNQDHMPSLTGQDGGDGWHTLRGGFRTDSALSAKDKLTIQGDAYSGREDQFEAFLPSITSTAIQLVDAQVNLSGESLQGIWSHTFSDRSDTTLQASFQRYTRGDNLGEGRSTFDIDFQHHFLWGERQNVVWGLDYRNSTSRSNGGLFFSLNPAVLNTQLFGSFVQDEIALIQNRLYLTVGTKLERDAYGGFSLMPSVRAVWTPSEHHTLWAAVSRAARTPADTDVALRLNVGGFTGTGGIPTVVSLLGNPHFNDEWLTAYEAGYRTRLSERLSLDLALYYNKYTSQETTEPITPFFETTPAPPNLVLPSTYENLMYGETHGLEIFANWQVSERWTLSPGYALEQIHMHLDPASQDTTSVSAAQGGSPAHSAQLRSHYALPHGIAWDTSGYFVSRIADPAVPSWIRLDTSVSWQWKKQFVITLAGQNLLKDHHLEYVDLTGSTEATLIKRSAYAQITWHFQDPK
jgi:iron complex outermembrane recepter protein